MGLDQYAYVRPPRKRLNDQDVCITEWRKHNRLQGFMMQLWHDKGCPNCNDDDPEQFNCVELPITKQDLDMIEQAIEHQSFPQADGFFWGNDSYSWTDENGESFPENQYWYKKHDEQFVRDARDMINKGWRVFYSCWY